MGQLKVGSTPLYKSIELTGRCGATVYVKREDKTPFGTFKDRRCVALLEASDNPNAIFVHITSGNSGYSMGMLANAWNDKNGQKVQVVNVVDKGIPRAVRKKLESCSIVHRMDLSRGIISDDALRDIAMRCVSERTGRHVDEKNVISVESHGLVDGYRQIIKEIAADGVKPTYIFCPVGGGELATELAAQAAETWGNGAPKIVGVTIRQNILAKAKEFLKKPGRSIADKLVSGYSKFNPLVKKMVAEGRIELRTAGEGELAGEYKWLNAHGISAEPSAAAAFCGAVKYDLKPTDTVVIINTGKGIYDQSAVEKRWMRRLLRGLKYAAVALGTAVAVIAAGWGLLADRENLAYRALWREAYIYADKDRSSIVDEKEGKEMLYLIRGMGAESASGLDYSDITPRELEFYVRYQRLASMTTDNITRLMMADLQLRYEKGTFRCETLHPEIPFLYGKYSFGGYYVRGYDPTRPIR
ncbi:MAG: PLP-dependent lyase/thiolase [Candidatus ainarchaeum sp.]|nr:PLP-dependent lyase/thiolase [Candidatus ainarchaeum sp.]